jgi:hypothetical protein
MASSQATTSPTWRSKSAAQDTGTAIEGADAKTLRELADKLRDKLKSCAVVLA